jgi:hypothetical protein
MGKHIPSSMSKPVKDLPWFTPDLRRATRKKHKLYNKAKKSKSDKDWSTYHQHKKSTQKAINKSHWSYVHGILQDSIDTKNSKPFWRYIKGKKQDNVGVAPIKHKGKLYSGAKDKAEMLNDQFKSVFTKDKDSQIPNMRDRKLPTIPDLEITIPGVEKLLKGLNVNKASGPDALPSRVLKEAATELAPALQAIFNQSLETGQLPNDWRKANISPIFKKSNKHLAENYRPVSLTCVCCKLLEHIITRHILAHSENHSLLTSLQHGFRSGLSCETQLLLTIQDITQAYNLKQQIDMIILDFSKAFDTVPHNRLLAKLEHYGIRGPILAWIREFLTNREQRVIIEGEASSSVHVDSGVPQGTVLGPLLFLLFINDLPLHVHSQVRLFADDALLYRKITSRDDQVLLQQDLTSLEAWAVTWGMRFNANKCNVMRITRSRKPHTQFYNLGGHILEQVNQALYLGVAINDNLKWAGHIDRITSKANSILAFLRRNLKYGPQKLKEIAYKSLVRSNLEYASSIWDPHFNQDSKKVERIQRRAARFVKRDYSRESSVTVMLSDLEWDSLQNRRQEARLTLLFKIINGLVSISTKDSEGKELLIPGPTRTRANNNQKFRQLPTGCPAYNNSFYVKTIPDWNKLTQETVDSSTPREFRARLQGRHID